MARFFKNRDESMGLAPGSLVFIGAKRAEAMRLHLIEYDGKYLREEELSEIKRAAEAIRSDRVSWINIIGLDDTERMREIGTAFDLHPLLLEDVLNTGQRPKLEEFEEVIFVVVKMLRFERDVVAAEQLSLVIGPNYLLTFQECSGDVFEPVRNRIRKSHGRVRVSGSDYLAYALLDTVVDSYIQIIEKIGGQIEDLEVEVLSEPKPLVLTKINELKRELSYVRKSVRPARDAVLQLAKLDSELICEETSPFLKDLYDISIQATDAIDTYREMLSDELNMYNSSIANRMNDIMKVLTIFAAIFIPLTFIAGIYGTNFEYLPELHYRYSYFVFLACLAAVAISMLAYFKRRGWL